MPVKGNQGRRGRRQRSLVRQVAEFVPAWLLYQLLRWLPLRFFYFVSRLTGDVLWFLLRQRRRLATENARLALAGLPAGEQPERVARASFRSLAYLAPEMVRLRAVMSSPDAMEYVRTSQPNVLPAYEKAKRLHAAHQGCIFVTPHLGNWEALPFAARAVGIPLVSVVRPLDNPMLEKLLYSSRSDARQLYIARRNSLLPLQNFLARKMSVGLLPDQSTQRGIPTPFLNRPAWTSPIPAILAVQCRRPIVVIACMRTGIFTFDARVSEPILPAGSFDSERAEVERLTLLMNQAMEEIIRAYPEQYFWMHNRWKRYDTRF